MRNVAAKAAEQSQALASRVSAHAASLRALAARLDAMEVSAQEARATGSGASAAGSSEATSVPYEQRQHAIISLLGGDEIPVELIERSVAILADAGVTRDPWSH